jgi:hypothetical protein
MAKRAEAPEPWQAWSVAIMIILGFAIGGVGVIFGWPMFWAGVAIVGVALLVGWRIRIMQFTEEYHLAGERVEPQTKAFHG